MRDIRDIPREGVFAVVADFNGDSIPDVALDGHEGDTPRVIAVLSRGAEYRVAGVTHGRLDPGDAVDGVRQTYLRVVTPGTYEHGRRIGPLARPAKSDKKR